MMSADVHRLIGGEVNLTDDVRRRPQVDRLVQPTNGSNKIISKF